MAVSPPGSLPRLAWRSSALSGPLHLAHARENVTQPDATPRREKLGLSLRCPAGRCAATSPEDCCRVQFVTITVFFLSQSKPSRAGRICSMQGPRQLTVSDVGCPTLRQLAGAIQAIAGHRWPRCPSHSRCRTAATRLSSDAAACRRGARDLNRPNRLAHPLWTRSPQARAVHRRLGHDRRGRGSRSWVTDLYVAGVVSETAWFPYEPAARSTSGELVLGPR